MRVLSLALLTVSLTTAAQAADFDLGPLRGAASPESGLTPIVNWEGGYVGAFAGLSTGHFAYDPRVTDTGASAETQSVFQELVLRETRLTFIENEHRVSTWLDPRAKDPRGNAFGVFGGYNWQLDEIVFGAEADYTRTSLEADSSDAIGRQVGTSNGYTNSVLLRGEARSKVTDYGTLRARLGYTMGAFLPYVTAGVALGQSETYRNVSVQTYGYHAGEHTAYLASLTTPNPLPPSSVGRYGYQLFNPLTMANTPAPPRTFSETRKKTAFGLAAGVGVDVEVTRNLFLRGEWQYVHFDDLDNQTFYTNTFRAAAGLKF